MDVRIGRSEDRRTGPWPAQRANLEAVGAALLSAALYAALAWSEHGLSTHAHRRLALVTYALTSCGLFGVYLWVVHAVARWRARFPLVVVLVAPLVFCTGWWLSPPMLSIDVYSYLADGYLWRHGMNPYFHGVRELRDTAEGAALAASGWRPVHGISPYGPLWTLIEVAIGRARISVQAAVLVLKAVVVLAGALAAIAIYAACPDAARVTRLRAALLFAWNPTIITEFAGEGHNDALMVLCVIVGLCWIVRRRTVAGAVALAAGVLAKYLPLLFTFPVLVYLWRTRQSRARFWRGIAAAVIVSVALATLLYAPFWAGPDTLNGVRVASHRAFGPGTSGMLAWGLPWVLPVHTASVLGAMGAAVVIAVVIAASLGVHDAETLSGACATIALAYVLIAVPRFWPWYVALPTALLALTPTRRSILMILALTFCSKLIAPLDLLRVSEAVSWTTEAVVMTMVGVWVPLLVWVKMSFRAHASAPQ